MTVAGSDSRPARPPFPAGDPEAIRATAAQLRRLAGLVAGVSAPTVDGWRAPAAARVRDRLVRSARVANDGADDLGGCAAALDRAADALEHEQQAWRAAAWRVPGLRP